MKFSKQDYAKDILDLCEKFYEDSNLPKIDLIEPIMKVKVANNLPGICSVKYTIEFANS